MNLDKVIVCDIEADALLEDVTKIHVMSISYPLPNGLWGVKSTRSYEDMKKFITNPEYTIVGHNFIGYDAPALEKILGVECKATVIDTLGLSWALYPWRIKHGLDEWGNELGTKKPEINDWQNLGYEDYKNRCESDVEINTKLWVKMLSKLEALYEGDVTLMSRYIKYINFKMECLKLQEDNPLKIDVRKLEENIEFFERLKSEKVAALKPVMPKVPKTSVVNKPSNLYKKDGSLSKKGEDWLNMLSLAGLPIDYEGSIEVIKGWEEPNPQSHSQIKDWLFSLGWQPKVFKDSTSSDPEKLGEKIPQVRIDGMLCKSVLSLVEKEPAIEDLDGLSVITHRLGVLNSFKKSLKKGQYVVASAGGLTNTLRLQHRNPICNLPSVLTRNNHEGDRPLRDGRFIRELIVSEPGYLFMGSDLSSLEDRSKQHFIYPYDPSYVETMMKEGFDPHLDLAVFAGALTEEQAEAHKAGEADFKIIRHQYKQANYSCTYGVGAAKLSESIGSTKSHAKSIIDAYWEKNWAVKKFADDQRVVKFENESWIINPLNNFRYWLKSDKDKFSTLNQGGATYIFDRWLHRCISKGLIVSLQYHDELASGKVLPKDKEWAYNVCKDSIRKVNKDLNLLREMDCEVQFGDNYAETH